MHNDMGVEVNWLLIPTSITLLPFDKRHGLAANVLYATDLPSLLVPKPTNAVALATLIGTLV